MNPMDVRVATKADKDALLDALVLSFSSDPCIRYGMRSPRDFLEAFRDFAVGMGGRAMDHGTAYMTDDGAAAALWLPPGVESDAEAMGAVIESIVPEDRLPVLGEVIGGMTEYHPREPHWYLAMVGVDPARQGQGLGSALIKHALRLCDEQGMPAYLESSNTRNIPLYERHGFEVMGVIQPGDFPGLYPMYRPARG